ncbi:FmdB family zinc ribbon protein [Nocardiopsis coralliicola]
MTLYRFRCPHCGTFDADHPMGTAPRAEDCGGCGAPAPRLFTAPALTAPRSTATRLRDAAGASAHAPTVVRRSSDPGDPQPPADPRHARLPRP